MLSKSSSPGNNFKQLALKVEAIPHKQGRKTSNRS
jgi:hypothetical protein